ncbi:basic salivary proline-rich protein 1-like [Herrania umbratica]|uniref:Basic salivary proline-rich protein 1-like n=1 Tax=Herrania umbratica TaxID=108875 RepID=A0A6J1B9X1_9ROSI|nr:basic salivary proline-rich protein 1-like [Herrania umbratica]
MSSSPQGATAKDGSPGDNLPRESSQSYSYPAQKKQQFSQGYPSSSQQSQPSVQVLPSQQDTPKIDYQPSRSPASDKTKQLQPLNGVPGHQRSNQQPPPQPQQQLPSVRVLPLPENPPKGNYHPPSFQTSDHFVEPSNGIPSQGYSTKDNHHLLSDQSSNQPPSKQNPGKNDHHPPSNQTSHGYQPRQPPNEVPSGIYLSRDNLRSNQPQKKQPPNGFLSEEQHRSKDKHPPTDEKSSNVYSQQDLPSALPAPTKTNLQVPSTAQGNLPKQQAPIFQADPPLQPQEDEYPIKNYAGIDAKGKVLGNDAPVLAFPDPSYLPERYLNQLPLNVPPAPPPPPPRTCCCSIL